MAVWFLELLFITVPVNKYLIGISYVLSAKVGRSLENYERNINMAPILKETKPH